MWLAYARDKIETVKKASQIQWGREKERGNEFVYTARLHTTMDHSRPINPLETSIASHRHWRNGPRQMITSWHLLTKERKEYQYQDNTLMQWKRWRKLKGNNIKQLIQGQIAYPWIITMIRLFLCVHCLKEMGSIIQRWWIIDQSLIVTTQV